MDTKNIKDLTRSLISQGKIEQAITVLRELPKISDDYMSSIILLKSQFNSLKKDMHLGFSDSSQYNMQINRITHSVLNLIDNLEDFYERSSISNEVKQEKNGKGLKIFYSYSHSDSDYLQNLKKHLRPLERSNYIASISDSQITPGDEWDAAIKHQLEEADIIIFLLSVDYLASDYIWRGEVKKILERAKENRDLLVIPIILRPCLWMQTDFGNFQGLPIDRQRRLKPISTWENKDEAYNIVAKEIEELIKKRNIQ
jgi:hypothetical protein